MFLFEHMKNALLEKEWRVLMYANVCGGLQVSWCVCWQVSAIQLHSLASRGAGPLRPFVVIAVVAVLVVAMTVGRSVVATL